MTRLSSVFVILGLVFAASVAAVPDAQARALDAERRAGLVGDTARGYMGIVKPPGPAGLSGQVDEINLKRRQHYRGLAEKRGTTLEAVEAIFGKELYDRTPSGEYFKGSDGRWARKP